MKDGEDGEGGEDGNRVKVGRKVLDAVVLLLALSACSGVPPMRHHIEAGQEPFVVFVADAPDGRGDLYAMTPVGSDVVQLTFSLPAEWRPSLSPARFSMKSAVKRSPNIMNDVKTNRIFPSPGVRMLPVMF